MENNKQVLFKHDADTKLVALTPDETGLTITTLIKALTEIQQKVGISKSDTLAVIFEDDESKSSWTIQSVAYDKMWVRLA